MRIIATEGKKTYWSHCDSQGKRIKMKMKDLSMYFNGVGKALGNCLLFAKSVS
jgi:hypothetical protein